MGGLAAVFWVAGLFQWGVNGRLVFDALLKSAGVLSMACQKKGCF